MLCAPVCQYDRAILNLENVTNSGSSTDQSYHSMVFIEWDAVMIDNAATGNGSLYWVSAGVEYNNENEVWVGQASFTTIIDSMVSTFTCTLSNL